MAVDNMRDSFGPNAVTEDHLLMVFRNSLEAVSKKEQLYYTVEKKFVKESTK